MYGERCRAGLVTPRSVEEVATMRALQSLANTLPLLIEKLESIDEKLGLILEPLQDS